MGRREFVRLLSLSVPASLMLGCSGCNDPEPEKIAPEKTPPERALLPDDLPFGIWNAMRKAIRRSPDHLEYQAQAVVASKDPERIFAFVRDSFVTRPDRIRGRGIDFRDRVNWGERGLLRSAIGTAREKAELLKSLYERAGFKAEILEGSMDVEKIGLDRLLFKRTLPRFEPDESIAPIGDWQKALSARGKGGETSVKPIDFGGLGEAKLLAEVMRALPADHEPLELDWAKLLSNTSIVRVEVDGKPRFANPHIVDLPFGEHGLAGRPRVSPVQKRMPTAQVKATLSASTTSNPHARFTLVEGTWRAEELVGRQLLINFVPADDPETLFRTRIGDIHAFIPTLCVQAENPSEDDVERMSFGGDIVNVCGDQIRPEGNGVSINGKPLPVVGGDPANASLVSSLEVDAYPGAWPEVRLHARVLARSSKTVPDLPASSFGVTENGREVPFSLLRNRPEPPRLLLVFDYSGSMKPEFRGAGLAPLVRKICTAAIARHPGARFQLAVISYDASGMRTFSSWLKSADEAERRIKEYKPAGLATSKYWTALATATNSEANLVVLFTDADGSEDGNLQQRSSVASGCGAVIIGVPSDKTNRDHLARLAAASGGKHILVDKHATAAEAVEKRLEQHTNWPYVLSYVSPSTEPKGKFTVRLGLTGKDPAASTTYEVSDSRPIRRSFAGLYLEVQIGGERVLRTLAGITPWKSKDNPVTDEHARDARAALFGDYQLSFEGEAPTTSALIDTLLGSFLSLEPLADALPGDKKAILNGLDKGAVRLAPYWKALHARLDDPISSSTFTYQEGWRAVLHSSVPQASGFYADRSDVLSFTNWRTVSSDPAEAWRATLAHSMRLSLVETANFDVSTGSVLRDEQLLSLSDSKFSYQHASIQDKVKRSRWLHAVKRREPLGRTQLALVPRDLDLTGYWSLNAETGSILGFLTNGTGGGETSDTERHFDRVSSGLEAFDIVMGKLNAVSPALSVWVTLEKIKVTKVKMATIMLLTMSAAGGLDFEGQLREEAADWAVGVVQDAAGGYIPAVETYSDAEGWYNLGTSIGGFISPR